MCYIELFFVNIILKGNNLAVPFEESRTVSFASSIMRNIVASSSLFRFLVKLTCCIAFGSASSFCCLFNLLQLAYNAL